MLAESWTFIRDIVLARVRDQGGLLHSHDFTADLLTRLQWLYNNQRQLVVQDFSMIVYPGLQLYTLSEALGGGLTPMGIQILDIASNDRHLGSVTLSALRTIDPRWPRAYGGRLESFMQLGYSLLLLWPALDHQETVTITATKLTAPLSQLDTSASLEIPAQATPKLSQLLELLLLLRQKDMISFELLLNQLAPQRRAEGAVNAATQTA